MELYEPKKESAEYGEDVEIVLQLIRHGERDKSGNLLDIGRERTRELARQSGIQKEDFDAIKAIGSDAGPKGSEGMQRALETAHLYAHELAGEDAFETRARKILSYESIKSPTPYDHTAIYNSYLPDNYDALPDDEKVKAAKIAQASVVNHVFRLNTPEAVAFKREMAGAYATLVKHYESMSKRLKSGSSVLITAGTHGGMMEFLLQQAMVQIDREGNRKVGFDDVNEIGGEFDPSDSYNLSIKRDASGNLLREIKVTFNNPERPQERELWLDVDTIEELANYYENLHLEDRV